MVAACNKTLFLFFILLFSFNCILSAQTIDSTKFSEFILPQYSILDSASADFNEDNNRDYVLVLKSIYEEDSAEIMRPLLLLMGKEDGSFLLKGRNDSVVLCKDCGGVWGDPFEGIETSGASFSIIHYGGSRYRWSRVTTFAFDKNLNDFFLNNDTGTNYDNTNPENSTEDVIYNKAAFGKTRFTGYKNSFID